MIGLSISSCVLDIAKGKVKIEDVSKIIGGTHAKNPKEWARVIAWYLDEEWTGHRSEAKRIILQLITENKIEQPRLTSNRTPLIVNDTYWVQSESEIQWRPAPVKRWSPCYRQVTCRECTRSYVCLPNDDYYESTGPTDGVCGSCLLAPTGVKKITHMSPPPPVPSN